MRLSAGRTLGHYEIVEPAGDGGMGEVYKARDIRLGRTVAVKILPEHLASRPDSRKRFEREAKTISRLNHPNICTLHDIGNEDDLHYLVMEYVQGETLASRLARGPLAIDEARELGIQIAQGLEWAHRSGVVHRDLKPANVMLAGAGAKILDFGLAKPQSGNVGPESMTHERSLTGAGEVVGTLSYMSPEQLRGEAVDARTDIFAYGAVLYEMFSGRPAFRKSTPAETISAILLESPARLSRARPEMGDVFDALVERCLRKDPDDRWNSAGDVAHLLGERRDSSRVDDARHSSSTSLAMRVGLLLTGFAVGIGLSWLAPRGDSRALDRATIALPPHSVLGAGELRAPLAVSPAGTHVAFLAVQRDEAARRIYVHELGALDAEPIPGTEEAGPPVFFSPDGEVVGFHANGTLMKVNLGGGSPVEICDAGFMVAGASWGDDGTIVVGGLTSGLMTVPATGGALEPLVSPGDGERFYAQPQFLTGERAVVFQIATSTGSMIASYSLATNEKRVHFQGTRPQRGSSSSLLYSLDGRIVVVDFDETELQPTGTHRTLIEGVSGASNVDTTPPPRQGRSCTHL